jgi:hypothetical protein
MMSSDILVRLDPGEWHSVHCPQRNGDLHRKNFNKTLIMRWQTDAVDFMAA